MCKNLEKKALDIQITCEFILNWLKFCLWLGIRRSWLAKVGKTKCVCFWVSLVLTQKRNCHDKHKWPSMAYPSLWSCFSLTNFCVYLGLRHSSPKKKKAKIGHKFGETKRVWFYVLFFKRKKQTAINSAMDNYSVSVPAICDKKKIASIK